MKLEFVPALTNPLLPLEERGLWILSLELIRLLPPEVTGGFDYCCCCC